MRDLGILFRVAIGFIKEIFFYTLIVYIIFIFVENKEILFNVVFMFVRLKVSFSGCKATQCFILFYFVFSYNNEEAARVVDIKIFIYRCWRTLLR